MLVLAESVKIKIIGHTDAQGNPDANKVLSKGRAQAVVDYLISKGIPANRFQEVDGKGQDEPIGNNSTSEGRAKNRRVEIALLK